MRQADELFTCPILGCEIRLPSSIGLLGHVTSEHHTPPVEFKPGVQTQQVAKGSRKKRGTKNAVDPSTQDALALPPAATASAPMELDGPLVHTEGALFVIHLLSLLTTILAGDLLPPSSSTTAPLAARPRIVRDPDLAIMGYSVEVEIQVAMCNTCSYAIPADDLRTHAGQEGNPVISEALCLAAIRRYKLLNANFVKRPAFFRAPIPLLLPPEAGFFCRLCFQDPALENYACVSRRAYNDHFRDNHKDLVGHGAEFIVNAHVQHLFTFKGFKNVFVVDPSLALPPVEVAPVDSFLKMVAAAEPLPGDRVIAEPQDVRTLDAFLYETGFVIAMVGANPYEAVALLNIPGPTEDFYGVVESVRGYYRHIAEECTNTLTTYNLRCIRSKKDGLVCFYFEYSSL